MLEGPRGWLVMWLGWRLVIALLLWCGRHSRVYEAQLLGETVAVKVRWHTHTHISTKLIQ
jgi:hypothetical protein